MEKPPELVRELYSLLVHPALRPAYEAYKERGEVEVVIYTRRPQLLQALNRSVLRAVLSVHQSGGRGGSLGGRRVLAPRRVRRCGRVRRRRHVHRRRHLGRHLGQLHCKGFWLVCRPRSLFCD